MATLSPCGLQALLTGVGAESPIPSFQMADIQNSPMDIYLSYLAEILVQLTGCMPQVAYESIQWSNEFGDLVVVAPRLRLKDVDANELAIDLKMRVGWNALFLLQSINIGLTHTTKTSFRLPPFLATHLMTELISGLSSSPIILLVYFCLTLLIVGICMVETIQLDFESSKNLMAVARKLWSSFHRLTLARNLMAHICEALSLAHTPHPCTSLWDGM
jgi:hypothetical protein